MKIFRCPCCEQVVKNPHLTLDEASMIRGYALMQKVGWTAERLLAERREDLDYISADLVPWLEIQRAAEATSPK